MTDEVVVRLVGGLSVAGPRRRLDLVDPRAVAIVVVAAALLRSATGNTSSGPVLVGIGGGAFINGLRCLARKTVTRGVTKWDRTRRALHRWS